MRNRRYNDRAYGRTRGMSSDPIFVPLEAGKFRDKVTIQQLDPTPDGAGGYIGGEWAADEGWTDVQTVWAYIQTINPSTFIDQKQWRDKQFLYQQWFNVILRYRGEMNTNMRLLYKNNRKLIVYSVVVRDELNWQINLFCREGG